ncbi:hypothetical protein LSCM1_02256 [Leishmania martiniquensis]|uniref:Transcription factor CBF/NF-Y/archaeal histone domain-containing protein n=1 Tax=Leishmania martiniquensis TaxID=1580590 RepID=A0A836KJS3_9TRYP|nr:hypothetical protein LSCM1_02256 [Leishmania martiniquensis]
MSAGDDMEGATYDETLGTTQDFEEGEEELASYLVPRLATYAPSTSPVSSQGGEDDGAVVEDYAALLSKERGDSGTPERGDSKRLATRAPGSDTSAQIAWPASHGLPAHASALAKEEVEANGGTAQEPFLTDVDADSGEEEDEYEVEKEDEEGGPDSTSALPQAHSGKSLRYASDALGYANAFAHSRVKELLKFEGSSSVISKDATAAACEAVALMMRDLVAMAAGEATRRHRKTVTYEDVARVAQLLDRFSFLAGVVPPVVASSASALATVPIVVGGNLHPAATPSTNGGIKRHGEPPVRSRSAHGRPGRNTAQSASESSPAATRSATVHGHLHGASGLRAGVHPPPGSGLRQATLRF